jgi:hypothetical protein
MAITFICMNANGPPHQTDPWLRAWTKLKNWPKSAISIAKQLFLNPPFGVILTALDSNRKGEGYSKLAVGRFVASILFEFGLIFHQIVFSGMMVAVTEVSVGAVKGKSDPIGLSLEPECEFGSCSDIRCRFVVSVLVRRSRSTDANFAKDFSQNVASVCEVSSLLSQPFGPLAIAITAAYSDKVAVVEVIQERAFETFRNTQIKFDRFVLVVVFEVFGKKIVRHGQESSKSDWIYENISTTG